MNNFFIRKAVTGDEKTLAHIQAESWKAGFCDILPAEELKKYIIIEQIEKMYEETLKSGIHNISLQYVDEKPHGLTVWSSNREGMAPSTAELIRIHSLCDKWGLGYGSAMLNNVFCEMKESGYNEVILWAFEKNNRAKYFYKKHGFQISSLKRQIFTTPEVMYNKKL